ncbi:MAG: hypothetical protein IPM46_13075 [Flavobacteriales bacterium]|nr:hypothetical protein [Flavobacteriales bacterium]
MLMLVTSARAQEDSTALYRKIHDYSQKRKVTRWIYEAIFVAPDFGHKPPAPKTPPRRVNPALRHTGKIVRSVQVTVRDPFGFSVDDTTHVPVSWLQRGGNNLHRRTRDYVVKDLLLVARLDTLDPVRIAESERLLRASPIVNDARVIVVPASSGSDSVDVLVFVLDKWSIDISAEGDLSSASITARERNLFGLGQQLQQSIVYGPGFLEPELSGKHVVYNIEGTYITSELRYSTSSTTDRLSLGFDRPFFSPLTRWAGGISGGKTWIATPVMDSTGERIGTRRLNVVDLDSWAGRSFALANDGTEPGRLSNIIVGVRHAETRFPLRPSFTEDSLRINSGRSLSLLGAGFSVRQYYRERYLFRFGIMEDVPEGFLLKATAGFRKVEGVRSQVYTSIEASRGRHFENVGYISLFAAYGTFWRNSAGVDATLRSGFFYFSDLVPIKRWHLRQFIRGTVVAGFDKAPYERLDINGNQLYGFSSPSVSGAHKELLSFETVAYAPYSLLGFRFAPVLVWGMGTIGSESDPVFSGRIYQAFALGILVRNENLLASTFEVSLSFFPYMPDAGRNVFEVGSFLDFTLKAPDYAFTRPDVVGYY